MGGTSPESQLVTTEQARLQMLGEQFYPIGMKGLSEQKGMIDAMQAQGGETAAERSAFGGARAGLLDASLTSSGEALGRERQSASSAAQGGNVGASLAMPADMGTGIARALYGSRITEASGALEEQGKMFGMQLGQSQQAGSGAMSAFGSSLTALPMMQNYNSTYANVMGALNLGSSLYGAGQQAGMFSGGGGFGGLTSGVPVGPSGSAWNVGGLSGLGSGAGVDIGGGFVT